MSFKRRVLSALGKDLLLETSRNLMDWLSRLETVQMSVVARTVIKIPLDGTPADVEKRVQRYGDFSKMNHRWYASDSTKD